MVIYGLRCPLRNQIRYIGKAEDVDRRYKAHLSCRGGRHPKDAWIRSLLRKGMKPDLIVLREVPPGEDWRVAERSEIVAALTSGLSLFNQTLGGDGASLSEEQRKKKVARMRDPATRAKMAASAKARWADPDKRAAAIAANSTPEKRALLSQRAIDRADGTYRARMSRRTKAAWSDPEVRARIEAGITPAVKSKVSAASKKFWKTSKRADICRSNLRAIGPDMIKKAAEARMTPEHRAKMRSIWDDEGYRRKLSDALKASWKRRKDRQNENA